MKLSGAHWDLKFFCLNHIVTYQNEPLSQAKMVRVWLQEPSCSSLHAHRNIHEKINLKTKRNTVLRLGVVDLARNLST